MCSRKWLIVALVACGLASACSEYNTNLSIQTSSSTLAFLSPSTAVVGGQGFTITANGAGFVTGALILWNGTPLTTTLVSGVQLTAPVPASDLTAVGTVQVAVQIPGSAQSATQNVNNTTTTEVSNAVLFMINAAPGTPPAITSLSASTTSAASTSFCSSQGFTLTVTGTNFTSDAIVNLEWDGATNQLRERNAAYRLNFRSTGRISRPRCSDGFRIRLAHRALWPLPFPLPRRRLLLPRSVRCRKIPLLPAAPRLR